MGNSEPMPKIFMKLGQIQVQRVSGTWSDLEESLSSSFPAMIFQKWTVLRNSGRQAHSGIVYRASRAVPRETRGRKSIASNLPFLKHDATYDSCKHGDMLPDTAGAHRH